MMPEITTEVVGEVSETPGADTPDVLAVLKAQLLEGISASPLAVAILGWLCDVGTDPYVVVIRQRGSQVVMRLSDEKITAPFGPVSEFLEQIAVLCDALGLSPAQAEAVTDAARRRLEPS